MTDIPTPEDEIAAGVHIVGLLLTAVLGAKLLRLADRSQVDQEQRRVVFTFVVAWLALYAASIAFHLASEGSPRRVLSALDNGAIFILIAACWAPIASFTLPRRPAKWMLIFLWGLAFAGLTGEITAVLTDHQRWFQEIAYVLYMAQGWVPVLLYGRTVFGDLSRASLGWLFSSTAVYSVGFVFYGRPELHWGHVIWHVAIVAGGMLAYGGVRQLLIEDHDRKNQFAG